MRVLVVNCGSSSVRVDLMDVDAGNGDVRRVAGESVGGIGHPPARDTDGTPVTGHADAVRLLCRRLRERGLCPDGIDAVGHRIVHGAGRRDPLLLDRNAAAALERASVLAPLHNAPALDAIEAVREELRAAVPMVAVFDTAFHHDLPPATSSYAIPAELAERHGIRRYGFHGIAHRYMSERWAVLTGVAAASARLVTLQLGSGCSAAAVSGGRSLDTTMGFTPLEGLVMATRCGDLDPALPGFLARHEGLDPEAVDELLNTRAGLLGLSGTTGDMKALLAARERGDERARLAVDVFCHRLRKQIGAYLAVLGGADAVVFGGGIGEGSPLVRALVCENMAWCGLVLDEPRNEATVGRDGRISADRSTIDAWVVAVDEATVIARDAACLLDESGEPER